jgi:hypothetical protein
MLVPISHGAVWTVASDIHESVKYNNSHVFHFQLFDDAGDKQTADCTFYLYNTTGAEIYNDTITGQAGFYTVAAGNFTELGDYLYKINCDAVNNGGVDEERFTVTLGGGDMPEDNLKIFNILAFITILSLLIIFAVKNIEFLVKLNITPLDVAYSFSVYFAMYILYHFNFLYGNLLLVNNILEDILQVSGWILMYLPALALILTLTAKRIYNLRVKKYD